MRKKLLIAIVCVLGLFGVSKAQTPEVITIGSGDGTTNNVPSYTYNYYSITQQIFTAAEMQNKSGEISSMSFKCTRNTSDSGLTRHFKIYMLNTSKSYFSGATDFVSVQESDLVFDGNVTFAAVGEWTTVNFTTPFQYKNAKNILLCVNDVTGTGTWGIPKFASETKSEDRCIYTRSYNSSPYDATAISVDGTTSKDVNQVQFTITVGQGGGEDPEPMTPANPSNLTAAPGETSVVLTWNEAENASSYNVYQDDVVIANVETTTYTAVNLEVDKEYCFAVSAVNGELESAKTENVCVITVEAQTPTTFFFDFNDGSLNGWNVFQGEGATGNNWATPHTAATIDLVINQLLGYYKGVDGTESVYSTSYYLLEDMNCTPNNYIVTEDVYQITETSVLAWDVRQTVVGKKDHYGVVVSEDGENYEVIWHETYSAEGETKVLSLADYAGKDLYIGFRHYEQTEIGDALCLDNITLSTDSTVDPIDPNQPSVPTDLVAMPLSPSSIILTWSAASNATHYNIYSENVLVVDSVTATTYTVEGLEAEKNYCFTVKSVKGEIESDASNEACATTTTPAPAAPTNLVATAYGETEVILTWDEVPEAISYCVYKNGELFVNTTGITYTVKDLEASTTYCFTVTALKNFVESEPSNEACATTDEPALPVPSTPTNVVATAQSTSEIILTWSAVDGATAYGVYYRGEFMGTIDAPATSFKLNDLNYNTEYCFQVSAFNGDLESGKSDEVCTKTLGESIAENANGFNIYPNPVENQLFIETEMNVEEISVYDMFGRKLSAVSGQQSVVDVAELNSGIYFVKVRTENGETVKRFIKK